MLLILLEIFFSTGMYPRYRPTVLVQYPRYLGGTHGIYTVPTVGYPRDLGGTHGIYTVPTVGNPRDLRGTHGT